MNLQPSLLSIQKKRTETADDTDLLFSFAKLFQMGKIKKKKKMLAAPNCVSVETQFFGNREVDSDFVVQNNSAFSPLSVPSLIPSFFWGRGRVVGSAFVLVSVSSEKQ